MTCRLEIPKLSRYFRSFLLAYFVAKAKRLEYVCMVKIVDRSLGKIAEQLFLTNQQLFLARLICYFSQTNQLF